ncbi:MAG: peptide chain release factor N(5)-glutamine methyltransferase [Oscillospiraceae bacterium]|nr:peptide chain release factor N(5)-glutamine methyltransferase [Oscillospiraceae bacterium]
MRAREVILSAYRELCNAGSESAMLDSQLLLAYALRDSGFRVQGSGGCGAAKADGQWPPLRFDKNFVILNPDFEVGEEEYERFCELLEQRRKREPLQYILGECEFYGLEFYVDESVLIPRGETEVLVEAVVDRTNNEQRTTNNCGELAPPISILEIGVGSGAISVALGKHLPNARITAIDISGEALEVARRNAEGNGVGNIEFVRADIFGWDGVVGATVPVARGTPRASSPTKWDIIVSNPPYIEREVCEGLQPEVARFEPRAALDGGADGLDFYRRIAEFSAEHLSEDGFVALEIGQGQENQIEGIFNESGFVLREKIRDLAGINRVLIFEKNINEE